MRSLPVGIALVAAACALGPLCAGAAEPSTRARIEVLSATYGFNVKAWLGNATEHVVGRCNGRTRCAYRIDQENFLDPAPGLQKDFRVTFRCRPDAEPRTLVVPPEAGEGSVVTLTCP